MIRLSSDLEEISGRALVHRPLQNLHCMVAKAEALRLAPRQLANHPQKEPARVSRAYHGILRFLLDHISVALFHFREHDC